LSPTLKKNPSGYDYSHHASVVAEEELMETYSSKLFCNKPPTGKLSERRGQTTIVSGFS